MASNIKDFDQGSADKLVAKARQIGPTKIQDLAAHDILKYGELLEIGMLSLLLGLAARVDGPVRVDKDVTDGETYIAIFADENLIGSVMFENHPEPSTICIGYRVSLTSIGHWLFEADCSDAAHKAAARAQLESHGVRLHEEVSVPTANTMPESFDGPTEALISDLAKLGLKVQVLR